MIRKLIQKARLTLLPLLVLVFSLSCTPALAENTPGYIDGVHVRMRSGPGTTFSILGTYENGQALTITGVSGDWVAVTIDGKDGYVYQDYVGKGSVSAANVEITGDAYASSAPSASSFRQSGNIVVMELEPSAASAPDSASGSSAASTETGSATGTVSSGSSSASTATVPASTPTATPSAGSSSSASDYIVRVPVTVSVPAPAATANPDDLDSYIVIVDRITESSANRITVSPSVSPSAALQTTGSAATVDASPSPSPTVQASVQAQRTGTVTGSGVRLRSGPGTTWSILDILSKGTVLSVTGTSGEWIAVNRNGVDGYVHGDYLLITEPAASESQNALTTSSASETSGTLGSSQSGSASGISSSDSADKAGTDFIIVSQGLAVTPTETDTQPADGTYATAWDGYVNASSVRMRELPSATSKVLAELSHGTSLKVTAKSGDWYKVICAGKEGFVYADYVADGQYEPEVSVNRATGAELGKQIASYALGYVGYPYTWGGKSPATGFDCSGFVQYVFSQFGYTTSRVANDVTTDGVHVDPADIQPGDILCFYSGQNYVGHVGIYIGNDTFVHAANSATGVVTTPLSTGYYALRGYEIRRVI